MIRVEPKDGVAILHLESGENRFSGELVSALEAAMTELEAAPKPIILTGSGKFFSNGLDLESIAKHGPELVTRIYRLFARFVSFPASVVAAINGHAFGAGLMLAAAADFRIMREDRGFLCFPEVDILIPMTVPFDALLQAKFSRAALCEGWLTGRRYAGPDALTAGFVDSLASEANLLPKALERAVPLVGKDPATVKALKRMLFASAVNALENPVTAPLQVGGKA